MLGAAMGALMVFNLLRAMRSAEAAGVSAVAGGLAEANLPIIIAIYFGIVVGFVGLMFLVATIVPLPASFRTKRSYVFFFNDTPTTEIYTLSLHDALPPPSF